MKCHLYFVFKINIHNNNYTNVCICIQFYQTSKAYKIRTLYTFDAQSIIKR